jgi:GNAT superfamily N-acetyltransferase
MSGIRLATYRNPYWPPLDVEILDAIVQHQPNACVGRPFTVPLVEYLLVTLKVDSSWPQTVQAWYQAITSWIPKRALDWWMRQLPRDDALEHMPLRWWQYRAQRVVVAWHGSNPVGIVALTHVYWRDRLPLEPMAVPRVAALYEVRGLVVDPKFRRSGVGTTLISELIAEARDLNQLDTFAVTTNPAAAAMFEACGATTNPSCPEFPFTTAGIRSLTCWCVGVSRYPACAACPMRPGRLWFWSTVAAPGKLQ